MDLLQTVKKEGSRGGRADFKWEDVKSDTQRENYLGHSLMAPVGRWQRNKDLSWYAKGNGPSEDDPDPEKTAADARAEEIRKVKEAEEDAMAVALGLPPPVRDKTGANAVPVAGRERASEKEMRKAVEEGKDNDVGDIGRGRGLSGYTGGPAAGGEREVLEVDRVEGGLRGEKRRRRSRSRDRERDRDRRHKDRSGRDGRQRRSPSRSRDRYRRRSRSRDGGRERDRHRHRPRDAEREKNRRHQHRSRSREDWKDSQKRRERSRSRSRPRDKDARRRDRSFSPRDSKRDR